MFHELIKNLKIIYNLINLSNKQNAASKKQVLKQNRIFLIFFLNSTIFFECSLYIALKHFKNILYIRCHQSKFTTLAGQNFSASPVFFKLIIFHCLLINFSCHLLIFFSFVLV